MTTSLGYVTSLGKSLQVLCTESGSFAYPDPLPPCRPAVPCDPIPHPPATTRLLNSTSTKLMEWDFAYFTCVRGSVFSNTTVPKLVNGQFPLQCGLLGKYPNPVSWGVCEISQCLSIPTPSSYYTSAAAPIAVNSTINYTCANSGRWKTNFIEDIG